MKREKEGSNEEEKEKRRDKEEKWEGKRQKPFYRYGGCPSGLVATSQK